ncbi:hypothetical protein NYQ31_09175 [Curtobacterium flaccumfaciens]|uniref:MmyB family transcriptional regulator n=1 Tax=Curtobacterium TaxID=2034 RepID=UPI000DAA1883|nr:MULTISPECIES: hypothetical protein [Curtobacterium]MCS6558569.1 hypothetical protein [Curtobacterium flaccumfaciens]PZF28773.1 hypothetical protein DEJ05_04235 [Curtobacterium sp. MCLR17_045]
MPLNNGAVERRTKLGQLIGPWKNVPALVYDRHLDVVVANDLAGAVQESFRVGANLARATFLEANLDSSLGDVNQKRDQVAAELREAVAEQGEDDGYVSLVGELAALSDAFAEAWAGDVQPASDGVFRFNNQLVGTLGLAYHRFRVTGPDADTLLVWRGADAESTERLAALARYPISDAQ